MEIVWLSFLYFKQEDNSNDSEITPDANTNMDFHRFDEQVSIQLESRESTDNKLGNGQWRSPLCKQILKLSNFFRAGTEVYSLFIPCNCNTLEKIHRTKAPQFDWQVQGYRNLMQRGDTFQRPHPEICVCHKVEDKRTTFEVAIPTKVCSRVMKFNFKVNLGCSNYGAVSDLQWGT